MQMEMHMKWWIRKQKAESKLEPSLSFNTDQGTEQ